MHINALSDAQDKHLSIKVQHKKVHVLESIPMSIKIKYLKCVLVNTGEFLVFWSFYGPMKNRFLAQQIVNGHGFHTGPAPINILPPDEGVVG